MIQTMITLCHTLKLSWIINSLVMSRELKIDFSSKFHPVSGWGDASLNDEEHVVLRRSNIATGGRCHLHAPSTASCDRHRSLEFELPLALSIRVSDKGSAVHVSFHCPLPSAYCEGDCEHLPIANASWSSSNFGFQVIEAAQTVNSEFIQ